MVLRSVRGTLILAIALACSLGPSRALGHDDVPVYTNDDLERMFGPPPPAQDRSIASSTPEDWSWVEAYLDRQYARIDADRQYELDRRSVEIAEREEPYVPYNYYGYASLGLRYPASIWWNNVHARYSAPRVSSARSDGRHGSRLGKAMNPQACGNGRMSRPGAVPHAMSRNARSLAPKRAGGSGSRSMK